MFISTPNIYAPEQLSALQSVFDRVWLQLSHTYVISRNDLACLIFALAADGGADDNNEIDVHNFALEVLKTVVQLRQRNSWMTTRRSPVSAPDNLWA